MPANPRQKYKAKLDSVVNHFDDAIKHMIDIGEEFKEHHDEVTEVMELAIAATVEVQKLVETIRHMI